MALHQFNTEDLKTYIQYYVLSKDEDKKKYEDLINDEAVSVTREEFTYDRNGRPTITIWYKSENL